MRISYWSSDVCSSDLQVGGIHTKPLQVASVDRRFRSTESTRIAAAHFDPALAPGAPTLAVQRRSLADAPVGKQARLDLATAGHAYRACAQQHDHVALPPHDGRVRRVIRLQS